MQTSEDNFIEYKQNVAEGVAKEIVAFLNSEPGRIIIGINKKREVVGIEEGELDDAQRTISDVITDQISPRCIEFVRQHRETLEGKSVIIIDVQKGDRLFYIKKYGLSERGCYIRSGSSCKSLEPDEIQKRYIASLLIPEKDIAEMPAKRQSLTFRLLKNYLLSSDIHINEETFEENFHLRTGSGEYNYMAEILADKNDIVINVAVFATEDKTHYLRREEFGGKCLLLAMEQAKNYIHSINRTFVQVGQLPRKETTMFDEDAFDQAWVNACVHNKWSESDHPGIYVYSNRMEIESYGGIPKDLTKEQFLRGKSSPVNKRLFSIFSQCGMAEESGHGVPSVVRVYGEQAYVFSDHFIDVVIPFAGGEEDVAAARKTTSKTARKSAKKNPDEIRANIVEFLRANPRLSRLDLSTALGLTEGNVHHYLDSLKREGAIERVGSDKGGYWKVLI